MAHRTRHPPTQPNHAHEALRALPSVEELRLALEARLREDGATPKPHAALIRAARDAIASAREHIHAGHPAPGRADLIAAAAHTLERQAQGQLRPVINATGVIINTNLGRSRLSERAIAQMNAVARDYSNLEFDLAANHRGSRQTHTRRLLRSLTSAADALVVNNNAAATLVTLAALAVGREVIIARGELVEIGGGFRIPDVLTQSGARLVEVGTTNRVRVADYATAITPETAMILVVHPSNFRVIGFTETPPLADLAALAHERGIPLMHDLGSGALVATDRWRLAHEPTVAESVRAGADIICFSGDKLLGGPQAGIIAGRSELLARIERHPLMRAIRIDKLTLAALEATLQAYADETFYEELPTWRAIAQSETQILERVRRMVARLRSNDVEVEAVTGESTVGGGSLPGETLPTTLLAMPAHNAKQPRDAARLADALRMGEPPIIARVLRGQTLLDLRTVSEEGDDILVAGIIAAWENLAPQES